MWKVKHPHLHNTTLHIGAEAVEVDENGFLQGELSADVVARCTAITSTFQLVGTAAKPVETKPVETKPAETKPAAAIVEAPVAPAPVAPAPAPVVEAEAEAEVPEPPAEDTPAPEVVVEGSAPGLPPPPKKTK